MKYHSSAEQPAQFAFRLVEALGENVWYVGVVDSAVVETTARQIESAANELVPGSANAARVDSSAQFENAIRNATATLWIGFGFETFDSAAWSKLDRDRSRLERKLPVGTTIDTTVTALIMRPDTFGDLQKHAPNLTSWIGGSVFHLASEPPLTDVVREARLEELRRWAGLTDDEVISRAADKTLPADPYYAEWLVLLDRGDLLGDA